MTLHLHIDRLVLDGLGPLDAETVQAAAEAELARLIAKNGLASTLHTDTHLPHLESRPIQAGPDVRPHQLAIQIAHSVHRGLPQ